jgi:uncharacterized repeat protein (TIGR01451 family)
MNCRLLQLCGKALALVCTLTFLVTPAVAQWPGSIRAMGDNSQGQLGDGTNTDATTAAVVVSGLNDVVKVAAGGWHSLAAKADGSLWSWGDNYYGQLGNGVHSDRNTPSAVSLNNVVSIAAGFHHSMALAAGTVWVWGSNEYGQLADPFIGVGPTKILSSPGIVLGLYGTYTAVAAGDYHSLALKSDGTVWAWGSNHYGQLGDGTNTDHNGPVQVAGLSGVVAIAAGGFHSMALLSNGESWTWGTNAAGQLGNGSFVDSNTPVIAWLLGNSVAITAGAYNSVAVRDNGSVWQWGTSSLFAATTNIPTQVSGLSDVVSISAAGSTADIYSDAIAAKTDGTIWWFAIGVAPQQLTEFANAVQLARSGHHTLVIVNSPVGFYPTSLNFGGVAIGSSSAGQNVSITNLGADPIVVNSLSIAGASPGDFSVTGPPLPMTLSTYAGLTATVRFTPADAGNRSATLVIADTGFQGPHGIPLAGNGLTPADIAVSQTVTQSGRRLTYTINVRNNGPGTPASISLSGNVPAQTQFVSIGGAGCIAPGPYFGYSCNFFYVPGGTTKTVTLGVDVTATQSTQIGNTVTVSSSLPDPRTGNNSSTVITSWTATK